MNNNTLNSFQKNIIHNIILNIVDYLEYFDDNYLLLNKNEINDINDVNDGIIILNSIRNILNKKFYEIIDDLFLDCIIYYDYKKLLPFILLLFSFINTDDNNFIMFNKGNINDKNLLLPYIKYVHFNNTNNITLKIVKDTLNILSYDALIFVKTNIYTQLRFYKTIKKLDYELTDYYLIPSLEFFNNYYIYFKNKFYSNNNNTKNIKNINLFNKILFNDL